MNHNPDEKSNFERKQDLRQDEEGFRLHQEEKRLRLAKRDNTLTWVTKSIYWPISILEVFLFIQFFLRLSAANTDNGFAQFIHNVSAPFIAPFSSLFISPTGANGSHIFDLNILIAIVVYPLFSYLFVSLLNFIFYHDS